MTNSGSAGEVTVNPPSAWGVRIRGIFVGHVWLTNRWAVSVIVYMVRQHNLWGLGSGRPRMGFANLASQTTDGCRGIAVRIVVVYPAL